MINRLLGLIILCGSLAMVYFYETSSLATGAFRVFHWPAIVLTGVGPFGLVLICSDWGLIVKTWKILVGTSVSTLTRMHENEGAILHKISQEFYTSGPKILESVNTSTLSPSFKKTISRLMVKMPTVDVRGLLDRERGRREAQLTQSINFLGLGVRFAPSIGMLGTILGMVQLLSSLQDPSHIGSHMGLALLTTFYGLFFSLVLWTPFQHRVERVLDTELHGYEQISHWLELLEHRKPAQYFADVVEGGRSMKLDTLISPPVRT